MSKEPGQEDVLIAEYVYRHEAEFGAGFLADAGIPFRVQADDAGGAYGGMTFTSAARIWVRSEDAEKASDIRTDRLGTKNDVAGTRRTWGSSPRNGAHKGRPPRRLAV